MIFMLLSLASILLCGASGAAFAAGAYIESGILLLLTVVVSFYKENRVAEAAVRYGVRATLEALAKQQPDKKEVNTYVNGSKSTH